ncbi:MAG: M36 family metallopeptidase [Bacteroidota bacterium]
MPKKFYLLLTGLLLSITTFGQHEKAISAAKQYLKNNHVKWTLTEADIADVVIDNVLKSEHNGVTHIYLHQRYQGVKIYNAISTLNILPNGEILQANSRFIPRISERVNTTKSRINPETAIEKAALHLGIKAAINFTQKESNGRNSVVYKNTNISDSDIHVNPMYQLMDDGKLHLTWDLAIDMTQKADFWNIRVDAQTGEILDKNNFTTHCTFGAHKHTHNCGFLEREEKVVEGATTMVEAMPTVDGSSYNVYAVPLESPAHGNRSIVNEPANLAASPFGWHDTNGRVGPEYTITRGNNAHAYADVDDNNRSNGDEPDGGATLTFDYPILEGLNPDTNRAAAVTQLFYMTNMMHDIFHSYGFTEQAGNFQEMNYTFPNGAGDEVLAEAQDGYNLAPTDENYLGNANFSTPSDGFNGRMQMYIWGRGGGRLLTVNSPEGVAGDYEVGTASFGPNVNDLEQPIMGQAVIVNDGSFSRPTLGCNPLVNADDVNGKIAIVDRGTCFFADKVLNAQNAGAIAVVVCNFENSFINMGAPANFSGNITIPALMLKRNDCQILRTLVNDGLEMTIASPPPTGPEFLDGDFDNGIVAHEYGHGISTRLSGGRSNSGCLDNDEQMGEGWSDFFTLVTSVKPGDDGTENRGIGTYVLRQENDAQGIRRFPYSTDMNICPFTYRDVIGTIAVHSVGEVWTAVLWDLYWALSEEYGWSEDLYAGQAGNNLAIQLVMDGLKIQACNPGLIDGRDAILAANRANNQGDNNRINNQGVDECLIWRVFARRGLGFSAQQNDERDRNDAIEAFDIPPTCTRELLLTKSASEQINAGGDIEYTLTIGNYKFETVNDIVLTDNLPEGLTFKSGSASMAATTEGNMVRFDIPQLASGEAMTVTYTATSATDKSSVRQFFDDMENGIDSWFIIDVENTNSFSLQDVFINSGENAWHVNNPEDDSEQILQLDEEIEVTGNQPALRFFHQYSIDEGTSGGLVEISTDGVNWTDLGPHFIKNGYIGPLAYSTFATPDLEAFWGRSEAFISSIVDLSAFKGERVSIRFRFGSLNYNNDNIPNKTYNGWFIDDVEFMDLFTYQSEACVTTNEGDNVCAMAENGGTVVEVAGLNTSVQDLEQLGLQFAVFPNPAGDYINVSLRNEEAKEGTIGLFNMNGQELIQQPIRIDQTTQVIPFNVTDVPSGFYLVRVQTNEGIAVKKVILE